MSGNAVPRSKRALDLMLLAVTAPIVVPIATIVAFVVRVRLGRPVLFVQERPGLNGQIFKLHKFRTMLPATGNPELDDDAARSTRVGTALRRWSLDELPEFWNILVCEMSFVGPRPLLVEYLPLYSARQRIRLDVLPGLTGLAQISGRNQIGWPERLELDARYAESWSLRGDLVILLRTIGLVLRREGINEDGEVTRSKFRGADVDENSVERAGGRVDNRRPSSQEIS